ncbi:hypothetical protein Vadar_008410 [Vaccinium darrowii]|uniref:Uncharacterized protein n=1 Tax=Vaccinium darrowii TaxID=229202 RepID=A0ACB7XHA6_9ERIC|nr:hypothetical protein Vadar_008410 [Vaccinium darrowii]
MLKIGIKVTIVSFVTVFPAVSRMGSIRRANLVYSFLLKLGSKYANDPFALSSAIFMYAELGCLDFARIVVYLSLERNTEVWNTMIVGYVQNNSPVEAINLFLEALESERPVLDEVTFLSALTAASQFQRLDFAQQLHAYLMKNFAASHIMMRMPIIGPDIAAELPITVISTLNQGSRSPFPTSMDFYLVLSTLLLGQTFGLCVQMQSALVNDPSAAVDYIKWSPTSFLKIGCGISRDHWHLHPILSLYSSSTDGNTKLWKYRNPGVECIFEATAGGRTGVAFSRDGRRENGLGRSYNGLQTPSSGNVQFDTTKNRFLAAGDNHVIKFWEMDSDNILINYKYLMSTDGHLFYNFNFWNLKAIPLVRFNMVRTLLAASTRSNEINQLLVSLQAYKTPSSIALLGSVPYIMSLQAYKGFGSKPNPLFTI